MQSAIVAKPCAAKKSDEPCRDACPGYETRSSCPPLIVIAMFASQASDVRAGAAR
jgi:hypothetical protein